MNSESETEKLALADWKQINFVSKCLVPLYVSKILTCNLVENNKRLPKCLVNFKCSCQNWVCFYVNGIFNMTWQIFQSFYGLSYDSQI